jgi:hypothetical protein
MDVSSLLSVLSCPATGRPIVKRVLPNVGKTVPKPHIKRRPRGGQEAAKVLQEQRATGEKVRSGEAILKYSVI